MVDSQDPASLILCTASLVSTFGNSLDLLIFSPRSCLGVYTCLTLEYCSFYGLGTEMMTDVPDSDLIPEVHQVEF
jgi:hypothetical protein